MPLRIHKADPSAGGVGDEGKPAYTFRVLRTAKADIRDRLERLFGYGQPTIYPDYPGFAAFGVRNLREEPA